MIASLSAVALMLPTSETLARSGGARAGFAPAHSISRPSVAHAFRHHRRNAGAFWPGGGYYDSSNGEAVVDAAPPASNDAHYTYTYDVPWDWAHRYPPAVAPSDRPYVSSCASEPVTVMGRGGREQTVNIVRCY